MQRVAFGVVLTAMLAAARHGHGPGAELVAAA